MFKKNYAKTDTLDQNKFFNKIKMIAGKFQQVRDAVAMFYCLKDPATPLPIKAAITATLIYLVVPTDAIFDMLPGGFIDDAAVITATLAIVQQFITDDHYRLADQFLNQIGK